MSTRRRAGLLDDWGYSVLEPTGNFVGQKVPEVLSLRRVIEQFLPPSSLSKILFKATSGGNLVPCEAPESLRAPERQGRCRLVYGRLLALGMRLVGEKMRCRSFKAGYPGDLQKRNHAAFQVGTDPQGKSSFHISGSV